MEHMENKHEMSCGGQCGCGHHKHMSKLLVRTAIVLVVFWFGFMIGELHMLVRSSSMHSGRISMMRGDRVMMPYQIDGTEVVSGTTTPAAPVKK